MFTVERREGNCHSDIVRADDYFRFLLVSF